MSATQNPEAVAAQLKAMIDKAKECEHCGRPVLAKDPRPARTIAPLGWLGALPSNSGYARSDTGWRWFAYPDYCLDCAERLDRYQNEDGDGFAAALRKMEREDAETPMGDGWAHHPPSWMRNIL